MIKLLLTEFRILAFIKIQTSNKKRKLANPRPKRHR